MPVPSRQRQQRDERGERTICDPQARSFYRLVLVKALNHPAPLFAITAPVPGSCRSGSSESRTKLPALIQRRVVHRQRKRSPGISLELSDSIGDRAEKLISEVPEVILTARKTGRAELDEHSLGSNVSEIEVPYSLESGRTRSEVMDDIRHRLQTLPGVTVEIGQPISHRLDAMLSGSEAQIAIKIFGPDLDRLYSIGKEIQNNIADVGGIVDINIEQQIPRPQIDIRPRRDMLARYGITFIPEFSRFVNVALAGMPVSQVYSEGLPYDVTLRVPDNARGILKTWAT